MTDISLSIYSSTLCFMTHPTVLLYQWRFQMNEVLITSLHWSAFQHFLYVFSGSLAKLWETFDNLLAFLVPLYESVADIKAKVMLSDEVVVVFSVSPNTVPHLNTISLTRPKEDTIVHCLPLSRWFLGLVCVWLWVFEETEREKTNHTTILCLGLWRNWLHFMRLVFSG